MRSVARATSSPPARRRVALASGGFTLIELLITLAILGICVALVSVNAVPGEREVLRVEAERLAQLLELASTEARLTGTAIAWTADANGYGFARYTDETGWTHARPPLRSRSLPAGVTLSGDAMRLVFGAHGHPVFKVALTTSAERYRVGGSPVGELRIEREEL